MKTSLPVNIVVLILLFFTGCEQPSSTLSGSAKPDCDILYDYIAVRIRTVGLTEITLNNQKPQTAQIKAYIELLDSAGSRIKSSGNFRFELYHFLPRSSKPKGKRIFIWPDIDLTAAAKNNTHWQDHLRAYQFDLDLDFAPPQNETYILQTTCLTPTGKRLSELHQLKYQK